MKLRNRLLALVCLLIFIGFGFVFFHTWVEQKPFGIILFVCDGLSPNTLTATRLYQGGAGSRLQVEGFPRLALVRNSANDFAVPDSAAAASALATGVKGNNRALAMDPGGKPLASILALAHDAGRATGIVTTGNLTDPTPAAFYAHATDARDTQSIAQQFAGNTTLDVVLAGGMNDFTPESKGGARKDGRDIWLDLLGKGHERVRNKAELENTPAFLTRPLTGIFANGNLPFSTQVESGSQQPSLADMVRRAIQFLQIHPKGYLLVVDAALVSRAAEQNDGERALSETADFDRAVATALQYAGEKTLILCVGKHDVGGLSLNGYPLRSDRGVALLGTNAAGVPSLTWSTGPNGPNGLHLIPQDSAVTPAPSGVDPATLSPKTDAEPVKISPKEPAAFATPQAIATARDMILLGSGPGSEEIGGFLENTDVFKILRKGL
ncbi:MAG: alkaline phosphatase [Chthoniobacteraceae bacterium]|nr:alkaline phosphatase [Chthoniobacteraceae bacterium]